MSANCNPTTPTEIAILHRWLAGDPPTLDDFRHLAAKADRQQLPADDLQVRGQLLQRTYPRAIAAVAGSGLATSEAFPWHFWNLWLPLACDIAARYEKLQRPLVWGILGLQGTGKTTLAGVLRAVLQELGYGVLCLSIDDLYKSYRDRQVLQARDPRLIWRGPPGTHDVDLGVELLASVRTRQQPLSVPRFDKAAWGGSGDRRAPELVAAPVDIVLFEGWFLGVRPQDPSCFEAPPWPIQTEADREFARDCNGRLAAYLPLWDAIDALLVLYPDDYRYSLRWRQEAEQRARAAGKAGMDDREVARFVTYFWRALHPELFVRPLIDKGVDRAIFLDANRTPRQLPRDP